MVSVIQSEDTNPTASQRMYCHSCSYEFSKGQNGLFQCPRCKQDFIEEVSDNISQHSNSSLDDFFSRDINPQSPSSNSDHLNRLLRVSVVVNTLNGNSETVATRIGNGSIYLAELPFDDMMNIISPPRSPVMTETQLQEIPKATITEEQTQIQCAICFDNFTLYETEVRQLQCNHLYHEKCIFPWVQNNGTCPVCRAPLPNVNIENASTSSDSIRDYLDNFLTESRFAREESRRHLMQTIQNVDGPSTSATTNQHISQILRRRRRTTNLSSENFSYEIFPIQARGQAINPGQSSFQAPSRRFPSHQGTQTSAVNDLRRIQAQSGQPASNVNTHDSPSLIRVREQAINPGTSSFQALSPPVLSLQRIQPQSGQPAANVNAYHSPSDIRARLQAYYPAISSFQAISPPVLSPQQIQTSAANDLRRIQRQSDQPAANVNTHHSPSPSVRVQRYLRRSRRSGNVQEGPSTSTAAANPDISLTPPRRVQRPQRKRRAQTGNTSLSLHKRPKLTLQSSQKVETYVISSSSSSNDDDTTSSDEPPRKYSLIEDSDSSS